MKLGVQTTVVILNIFALSYYPAVLGLPRHDSAEKNYIPSPDKEWTSISSGLMMWSMKRLLGRDSPCTGDSILCSGIQP